MGVWIEICYIQCCLLEIRVTPFVGVWIEIRVTHLFIGMKGVTPFVGVWIEIVILQRNSFRTVCHSLRGSVD